MLQKSFISFSNVNINYVKNNLSIFDYDFDGKPDLIYTDGYSDEKAIWLLRNNSETGLATIDLDSGAEPVQVFPNPAKNTLNLPNDCDLNGLHYQIIANQGMQWHQSFGTDRSIDIQQLPAGNYQLLISNDAGENLCYANFTKVQ